MTKLIVINTCRQCPYRRYEDVCYKDNTRIYLFADEEFPEWCPLPDKEEKIATYDGNLMPIGSSWRND